MKNENCNQDRPSVFDYPTLGGFVAFWGVMAILAIPTAIVACILWVVFGVRTDILSLLFTSLGTVLLIILMVVSAEVYIDELCESVIKYRKDVKEWKQNHCEKEGDV